MLTALQTALEYELAHDAEVRESVGTVCVPESHW